MGRCKKYENRKYFYPHVGYPRIMVAPNQEVKVGDVLCILDRLGIEDKILAAEDGVVHDINLEPVGTLANCNDYILTLKHLVTEEELKKRREEKKYQFISQGDVRKQGDRLFGLKKGD